MTLTSPVRPNRGTRGVDAYGSGQFAADRDGGTRAHRGRDYIALLGDSVVSPIDGIVKRRLLAYAGANLEGLEIEGPTVRAKILYLHPEVAVGSKVVAGQPIGTAQDVAAYWMAKEPRPGDMQNHVHLEVMVWIDPEEHMETRA